MIARQYRGWNRLVRSFWENSIVMSSLWDRRTKIQPGDQYAIHETSAGCPEVPVEALLPALLPVPRWPPWDPIPAVPFVSLELSAEWLASCPLTEESRDMDIALRRQRRCPRCIVAVATKASGRK